MGKTVLILGNGFDLAHGLPTRYSDFLEFCSYVLDGIFDIHVNTWFNTHINDAVIKNECREYFIDHSNSFINYLDGNVWYDFLYHQYEQKSIKGENWIDFESEISSIIQLLDKKTENLLYEFKIPQYPSKDILYKNNKLKWFLAKYAELKALESENPEEHIIKLKMKELRKELYNDLENLTKALEIYLSLVECIPVKAKLNEIKDNYDYIINFNYTSTYKRVYGECDDCFYIHGKLKNEPNNMVLGIDEYWSKKERDKHTNFTVFKKFAQRIQKDVGIENYNWFDEILYDYKKRSDFANVYIFGHSLDVTDKDILRDYLNSAATIVTIYCKDKETEGEYIANIIQMIGEKRLLEKVNQDPPKLKFVILEKDKTTEKDEEEKDLSPSGAAP